MKHTLGPWYYKKTAIAIRIYGAESDAPIAGLNNGNESDARLIVAAPDLLAALQILVARYPNNVGMEAARAAITKATEDK